MQSFGGPFHSKILTCNLSWDWSNRRLQLKEASSCHLLIEMKYTLVKFLKYVIGSSLIDTFATKSPGCGLNFVILQ